jgi:hypothetical protein
MAVLTSQAGESWPRRILSWIYPAREWASEQRVDEQESGGDLAGTTKPAARKPVILRAGEAK